ncbi:Putative ribonuclease H protein At1g65750 [Linum perenne]
MGGFNAIIDPSEKIGGLPPRHNSTKAFKEFIFNNHLMDLGYTGNKFTWSNLQEGDDNIKVRLDRELCSFSWRTYYDKAIIHHEPMIGSDHSPIRLQFYGNANKKTAPFRFDERWMENQDCLETITNDWNPARSCQNNLMMIQTTMRKWARRNNMNSGLRIKAIQEELVRVQALPTNEDSKREERSLLSSLDDLWREEERFWKQRARINWLNFGDRNTKFFHAATVQHPWIPSSNGFKILSSREGTDSNPTTWMTPNHEQWDPGKLRETFDEEEARTIEAIPIGPHDIQDHWVWHFSKDGKFSVMSAYHCSRTQEREEGRNHRYLSKDPTWSKLWNLPCPPKYQFFLWRITQNAMATRKNLWKRKCADSTLCPICGDEEEDISHCLFRCSHARRTWEKIFVRFRPPPPGMGIMKWIIESKQENVNFDTLLSIAMLWNIWRARNDKIFNDKDPVCDTTILLHVV